MIGSRFTAWPLIPQILHGGDGTGSEAMRKKTRELALKNQGVEVARSVCPYCGAGPGRGGGAADARGVSGSGCRVRERSLGAGWASATLRTSENHRFGKITGENESVVGSRESKGSNLPQRRRGTQR